MFIQIIINIHMAVVPCVVGRKELHHPISTRGCRKRRLRDFKFREWAAAFPKLLPHTAVTNPLFPITAAVVVKAGRRVQRIPG